MICMAYKIDAFTDITPSIGKENTGSVWRQNEIGCSIILFGFFEFRFKGKEDKLTVTISGISKKNILDTVVKMGFRKRYLPKSLAYLMVKVEDNIMQEVTTDIIRTACYQEMLLHPTITIDKEGNEWVFNSDLLETVWLKNQDQIFNKNFLELMSEFKTPALKDDEDYSYFLFENCFVKVTAAGTKVLPYSKLKDLNACVWRSHIKQRRFNKSAGDQKGMFEQFVFNISNHDQSRNNAAKSAIGYLLHCHNGEHMGQSVVCYDEAPTDRKNPQGGTGKGLFAQGIGHMREVAKIDGKHFKADDKFRFQTVELTSQVVVVDDLHKDVSFETFFSCLTDGFTIEKKNRDTIKLAPENSPKLLFSMNTMIEGGGTTNKRRIFVIEFSNYYSKRIINGTERPIEDEHGGLMFHKATWKDLEWNLFTTYMLECVEYYLQHGLKPYELVNVVTNTLIQTTSEDFATWIEENHFDVDVIYKTKEYFEDFKNTYYGVDSDYKQRTFTNNLGRYASLKNLNFEINTNKSTKISEFIFRSRG
jgi:hypothetical protein